MGCPGHDVKRSTFPYSLVGKASGLYPGIRSSILRAGSKTIQMKGEGKRFNEGKTRYDLIPQFAQEQYAKVLTKGAEKYADRNWESGMDWSKVISSLERHLAAVKNGEDYDRETGLLHSAHIMCNAAFLTEYYRIYPQGDDRPHRYLSHSKIGLDIDEVLADFVGGFYSYFNKEMPNRPEFWSDPFINKRFYEVAKNEEFWMSIPVKTNPSEIPFEPHCYITSRPICTKITQQWLHNNGFPDVPVYTVGHDQSKIEVAQKSGIEVFVDDRYRNFIELTKFGIFTYLFDAPHNRRYDVGFRRIKSLKEIKC